ncbi:MAG: HD domain-containing protein [Paracoccaceae bacterium]
MSDRITAQIAFLREVDRLKSVDRANFLLDGSRFENSAEHSWHIALFALICAPMADPQVHIENAIRMLILHDLVEIDSGDHPIHLETDWDHVARIEQQAADRLFALLPPDQQSEFHTLRTEFEDGTTPTASFAKDLDRMQPVFQVLCADTPPPDHLTIARDNLSTGRARPVADRLPDIYDTALALLNNTVTPDNAFSQRLSFLTETDQLKLIYRASKLADASRFENSAEHSWHIMLYALVLGEYAAADVDIDRVIQMLLLHDIVEIDAGDAPIHGNVDKVLQAAKEEAAADRLFGLLPHEQGHDLRNLWDEFEAAQSPDALFAKAIDRIQVPVVNLINGGGTFADYDVTYAQIESRVGIPVRKGAPILWDWLSPQVKDFLNT